MVLVIFALSIESMAAFMEGFELNSATSGARANHLASGRTVHVNGC